MAAHRGQQPPSDGTCRRCREQQTAVVVRSEPLCKSCFERYVTTKVVKRMETFRVRNAELGQQRQVLLALSLGPGSVTLLHVLSRHLKRQAENSRRTGFGLHVLHVQDHATQQEADVLAQIKTRYPEHMYSVCTISDVLSQYPSVRELFPTASTPPDASHAEQFEALLASLDSTTAKKDVHGILRNRLILAIAKQNSCEAVLWGDSTTRLAGRTLAETAKGRGFALSWLVNDGQSPQGLPVYYPMRELLTKEIIAYAESIEEPLSYIKEAHAAAVSSRNATIDSLMQQYFESAEQDYPSIVANVVRTTGKLRAEHVSAAEQQCELCEMPLLGQAPERSRLCYGCIRALG